MKRNHYFQLLTITLCLISIFSSCKKDPPVNPYEYHEIVTEILPVDGSTNIAFDSVLKVTLRWIPGKDLELKGIHYKVVVDGVILYKESEIVSSEIEWTGEKEFMVVPLNKYVGNSEYTLEVNAHYEVLKGGTWSVASDYPYYEKKTIKFYTYSISETELEENNVFYSYPVANQYHYLQNESTTGFLKLKIPQDALFSDNEFVVKISNSDGYTFESAVSYNAKEHRVEYSLPSDLENEEIYKLELIKVGSLETLHSFHFRTSKFNNFLDKVTAFIDDESIRQWPIEYGIHTVYNWYDYVGQEYFDLAELEPLTGLIRLELDAESSELSNIMIPIVYNHLDSINADFDRNKIPNERLARIYGNNRYSTEYYVNKGYDLNDYLGLPPLQCMYINQSTSDITVLTSEHINANNAPAISADTDGAGIYCSVKDISSYDYGKAAAATHQEYWDDPDAPDWIIYLRVTPYKPVLPNGTWVIHIKYTLPDGTVTNQKTITWIGPSY